MCTHTKLNIFINRLLLFLFSLQNLQNVHSKTVISKIVDVILHKLPVKRIGLKIHSEERVNIIRYTIPEFLIFH